MDMGNIKIYIFQFCDSQYWIYPTAHWTQLAHTPRLDASLKHFPDSGCSIRLKTQTELDLKKGRGTNSTHLLQLLRTHN